MTIWAARGLDVELKRTARAEVKVGRSGALMLCEETSWSRRGRRREGGRKGPAPSLQLSGRRERLVEVRNTAT